MIIMKKYIIYKITNIITKKIYIGKHVTVDINDNYFGSGSILKQSIKKYGIDKFVKEIIEYCENDIDLNEKEIYWIRELNTISPNGYNINIGGTGGDNFTYNPNKEVIRKKLKLINIGRKASDDAKHKMINSRKGKKIKPCNTITCPHCGKVGDKRNMVRWHFDNCKENPNNTTIREIKKIICPFCNEEHTYLNASIYHFEYCKLNPNRIFRDFSYKANKGDSIIKSINTRKKNGYVPSQETKDKTSKTLQGIKRDEEFINKQRKIMKKRWENQNEIECPYCHIKSKNKGNLTRWHFDNCKKNPNKL